MHALQAEQVVLGGALQRRVLVLADVDAEHAPVIGLAHARAEVIDAAVVEAHAVDDRPGLGDAEQPRLRVARLRARRDGADLEETETERGQRVDMVAVLVQPRGQPDRIGELEPHATHRIGRRARGDHPAEMQAVQHVEPAQRHRVRAFARQQEQQSAQQGIRQFHAGIGPGCAGAHRIPDTRPGPSSVRGSDFSPDIQFQAAGLAGIRTPLNAVNTSRVGCWDEAVHGTRPSGARRRYVPCRLSLSPSWRQSVRRAATGLPARLAMVEPNEKNACFHGLERACRVSRAAVLPAAGLRGRAPQGCGARAYRDVLAAGPAGQ